MTVKELIDKLQQFNGDRVVLVEDDRFVMITTTVK